MNITIVLVLHMLSGNISKDIQFLTTFSDIEECEDTGFYTVHDINKFHKNVGGKKITVTYSCVEKKY